MRFLEPTQFISFVYESVQMYDGDDYSLEGDMSVPSSRKNNAQPGEPDFNTLDEPIKETIVSSPPHYGRRYDTSSINDIDISKKRVNHLFL